MFHVAPDSTNTLHGGVPARGPKGSLDAVVNGWADLDRPFTYFFSGPWYVTFDWRTQRVGKYFYRQIAEWKLPPEFSNGVDAALNDCSPAGRFKTLFFKGGHYAVYDWTAKRAGPARPVSELGLDGPFAAGVDTAINGRGPHDGKAYLIKDRRFVRLDWARRRVDQEARDLNTLWRDFDTKLASFCAASPVGAPIRASLDAAESFGDTGQVFVSLHYRYDTVDSVHDRRFGVSWQRGYVATTEDEVRLRHPGVLETLQIARLLPTVAWWIDAARGALAQPSLAALTRAALAKHFRVEPATEARWLPVIRANFEALREALAFLAERMGYATTEEAEKIKVKDRKTGVVSDYRNNPMWASHRGPVVVNQGANPAANFAVYGPRCKSAMVLHELLHQVDAESGREENHHYEHSSEYAQQTAAQAAHNASSYACFAQYVAYQRDTMYGAKNLFY